MYCLLISNFEEFFHIVVELDDKKNDGASEVNLFSRSIYQERSFHYGQVSQNRVPSIQVVRRFSNLANL